jgi:hypothetical protein
MIQRILVLAAASLILMGMDLPENGPRPDVKPPVSAQTDVQAKNPAADTPKAAVETPSQPSDIPVPAAKPDEIKGDQPESDAAPSRSDTGKPGTDKPAAEKPDDASGTGKDATRDDAKEDEKKQDDKKDEASPAPPPIVKEDPQKLEACLRDLKAIGAEFENLPPVTDEQNGCGIEKPIALSQVLPGIPLSDKTPMRCEAALSLARWMKDLVEPSLKTALPERRIVGISNASSYVCRLRNHAETGKISEHARGNAIDIAGFKLDNDETIAMTPKEEDSTMTGAFQRTATAGACLYFTTVLSPGSDSTHQDHLHLDVMERKGGYRYCR